MFRFFLDFDVYPNTLEVTEVVGFDGQSFKCEKKEGEFGLNVSYGSEEISLRFYDGYFEESDTETILPDGTTVIYNTMGYEWLCKLDDDFGYDANVKFRIQRNGTDFTQGNLDFETRVRNNKYIEFKVVQESARAEVMRLIETKVDVFSDRDLNGGEIEPLEPVSMLLKGKSEAQNSAFRRGIVSDNNVLLDGQCGFSIPIVNEPTEFGIQNTFVPFVDENGAYFYNYPTTSDIINANDAVKILRAVEDLGNIKVKINKLTVRLYAVGGVQFQNCRVILAYGSNTPGAATVIEIVSDTDSIDIFEQDYEYTIPSLFSSQPLRIVAEVFTTNPPGTGTTNVFYKVDCESVEILVSSTPLDSVIYGAYWYDFIQQNLKAINNGNLIAPKFDVGGKWHDNLVFNDLLIRQFTDKPFYTTLKERFRGLSELCCGYQILRNGDVFIGHYKDFYPNNEIGVFLTAPDDGFEYMPYNNYYTIVGFNYKYNRYQQDRDAKQTLDSVHTEREYKRGVSPKVEGIKTVEVNHSRDPYDFVQAQAFANDTDNKNTSLSSDNDVSIIDVIDIPEGTKGGFARLLLMRVVSGNLEILNNNSEGDGNNFDWGLRGFEIGDTFTILSGQNDGDYTVTNFTRTVLYLTPQVGTTPTFSGNSYITVEYPLTGVGLVNRTSEGFDIIEGVDNPDNYSNLRYTPRANVNEWGSYLATCNFKLTDTEYQNTFVKNNGNLRTQFDGGRIFIEGEDLQPFTFDAPVITPQKVKTKVRATFDGVLDLIAACDTVNEDGTIGGFVRVLDDTNKVIKGYIRSLSYVWVSEELTLELELKYEADITTITKEDGIIYVNEAGYDVSEVENFGWYEVFNGYVRFYDSKFRAITNRIDFTKVSVNGSLYTDVNSFVSALRNL